MDYLLLIILAIVFIISVMLHEIAHGYVAYLFGDDTAKISGRLSLNPLVHLDPVGSIMVPLILLISGTGMMFGWAKPVPVNSYRLRGGLASLRWVALAGIITNLGLAIAAAIVFKITTQNFGFTQNNLGVIFFNQLLIVNIVLGVFNLIPLPGFDGWNFLTTFRPISRLVSQTPLGNPMFMAQYGLVLSIMLLFLVMPIVANLFQFVFGLFAKFFGI
ncbi:MAG: site-2 protease family protein [Patescibacteria group bacterium]|nr:site-2 protease family protein [Patescibacteria group bacterium]